MPKQSANNAHELTDADIEKISETVVSHGNARKAHIGQDFNEADYLCGAMAVYDALSIGGKIPMMWTIGIMAGRTPFSTLIPKHVLDAIDEVTPKADFDDDEPMVADNMAYFNALETIATWREKVKAIPEPEDDW